MSPIQVLAACGIVSGVLSTAGGLLGIFFLIGLGSLIMLTGNLYALLHKEEHG